MRKYLLILAIALVSTSSLAKSDRQEGTDRRWIEDENGRLRGSITRGAYGRQWIEDERGRLKGSIEPRPWKDKDDKDCPLKKRC